MNLDETPQSVRFEKLVLEKIHQEMRSFADAQELMRRELSEIKVQLAEFRGESKGKGKSDDNIEARLKVLEERVDALRMFRAQVAVWAMVGSAVLSAAIGLIFKKFGG